MKFAFAGTGGVGGFYGGLLAQGGEDVTFVARGEHYRHTGSHAKSSLLIDIENKRRTEIDALNGTIVRLAKANGIASTTA